MKRFYVLISVLALCVIYFQHSFKNAPNPNEFSRLYQIRAIVENHTLAIDSMISRYGHLMDKSHFNGHFYSDKSFGMTLLCLPFYFVYHLFFGICGNSGVMKYLLSIACAAIPNILFVIMLYIRYIRARALRSFRLLMLCGYCLGTISFVYSTLLYSHVTGAALLGIIFMMLDNRDRTINPLSALLIGMGLGLACIIEYPMLLICIWLGLFFLYRVFTERMDNKILSCILVITGGLISGSVQMLVNYLSFGSPFSTGYAHKYAIDQTVYHSTGFFGVAHPSFESVWGITFSAARGMFYFSPILLLAIPALVSLFRHNSPQSKIRAGVLSGIILTYSLFASSVVDWRGGWTTGPRYYLPAIPFMLIAIISRPWFVFLKRRRWFPVLPVLFMTALVWSVIHCVAVASAYPFIPELIVQPLWEFAVPLLAKGYVSPNIGTSIGLKGVVSLIPLYMVIIIIIIWCSCLKWKLLAHKRMYLSLCAAAATALSLTAVSSFQVPPDRIEKHIIMNYIYRYIDKPVDQLEQLYILVAAMPYNIEYRTELSEILLKTGVFSLSALHAQTVLTQSPDNTEAKKYLIQARNSAESLKTMAKELLASGTMPRSIKETISAGRILIGAGYYAEARRYFLRAQNSRKGYTGADVLLALLDLIDAHEPAASRPSLKD
ncbi:MAG: hypothetical protein C4541_08905 [Candidatus Auribacter fodinae]|jgi:hypothetical protein|uniref:Glycosyltransferase RgtA/B/C/D-like domain-containing protein n=1 Tax=Candidatus Auribacter fodinae TaxID=2093366 RepID=A0A3A4R761_9BACT|nr:MAG: hypothetical protein C4541_08905 [Candidatus Auribacter fodinae]